MLLGAESKSDPLARDIDWIVPVGIMAAIAACLWLAVFPAAPFPPFGAYVLILLPGFTIVAGIFAMGQLKSPEPQTADRTQAAVMGGLLMLCILGFFTSLKIAIPALHPFWFDPYIAEFERSAFGEDPWRLSQALLWWATPTIDLFYILWWPIQSLALAGVLFSVPSDHKSRALIAYGLIWLLLGVGLAMALSSVGPIFYERLTGGTQFAGLADHTIASGAAAVLWAGYTHHVGSVGLGISAMPSLHIAISAWTALALRRKWIGSFYVAAMWISSVHLGWHYVADGLVGILGALLLWKVAGFMRFKVHRRTYAAAA